MYKYFVMYAYVIINLKKNCEINALINARLFILFFLCG